MFLCSAWLYGSPGTPRFSTSSPLTNVSNASATFRRRILAAPESNHSFFVDDLTKAYSKTCPQQASPPDKLLILQTSPHANLGLNNIIQTWMPVRHDILIFSEINGWFILFLVFSISCAYQFYFYDQNRMWLPSIFRKKRENKQLDDSYFERPCFARWMEYALTSPLQILLIASVLLPSSSVSSDKMVCCCAHAFFCSQPCVP